MPVGEKYPENFRHFCLALHYFSPRAYTFVRKTFNEHMPHPKTIQAWFVNSDINGEPGIQDSHLNKLTEIVRKMSASGSQLVCSLSFDEIHIRKQMFWSLQKASFVGLVHKVCADSADSAADSADDHPDLHRIIATQAIVFMLKGINANLKFPVAYFLMNAMTKEQKKELLCKIIGAVSERGIKKATLLRMD